MLIRTRVLLPLLALALAGCAQQVGGTATAADDPPPSAERPVSSTSAVPSADPDPGTGGTIDIAALPGTWRGSYTCAQGATGLELEISEPDGDTVPAIFRFFPVDGGAPTPSGSFSTRGSEANGQFVFRQEAWIEQPEGYVMVDLGVASVENSTMTGRVGGPSCGDFSVTKQG
ncbi:hypothetical protein ABZ863_27445 [Saccharomonospora sp. NPDC046836]|uniref:hypothetical protein n=1 Tax=Saccharomonospora sp. NPDC046836 TaxID=3156921 RepID=UPI0033C82275